MNRKLSIAAIVLSLAAMAMSAVTMNRIGQIPVQQSQAAVQEAAEEVKADSAEDIAKDQSVGAEADEKDIQYVLYVGTNDKDTNEPVFAPEEAKEKLKGMLIKRFGGYTIQEANGGWIDDSGKEYQEYTLVVYLSDTTLDDVHALCDEIVREYHQSAVLIQGNETTTEFYSGE